MEKRKLASIQYIHHITSIEGADRIECIHVLGWQCVAEKDLFRVRELCDSADGAGLFKDH